jgi:hypothetical protein
MRNSVDRASVESRGAFREFEKEEPLSSSGLTYADARYSCSSCGSCGAVVLTWGVLSNEMRDDLSTTSGRVVWILLLVIVLATSGFLVSAVEDDLGVMRPDRRDMMGSKYTTARLQCAGLGVVNVIGLLFGLFANEARESLGVGDVRTGWVCFFVMWLISTFNFLVVMMTTRPQLDRTVGEVTPNPARHPPASPVRGPPPRPGARPGPGPVRQSVEGLTSLNRDSLSRDSVEGARPVAASRPRSPAPPVVLSSVREERLSASGPHRRSTSHETFVA